MAQHLHRPGSLIHQIQQPSRAAPVVHALRHPPQYQRQVPHLQQHQQQRHIQQQWQQQWEPHSREAVACEAFFDRLFGGGGGSSSSSGLAERPLYSKKDMFDLGGLSVAPMGLGTWAWGNK